MRLVLMIGLLLGFPVLVEACSLAPGTFIRSNYELIDAADAIIVAKAVRMDQTSSHQGVIFETVKILKGTPTVEVKALGGRFGSPVPSDPNSISHANPEAYGGMCNRVTYERGGEYILILKNTPENGFIVFNDDAFSRINEDYFGENTLWYKTILTYLSIQKNPDRMAQLEEMIELALNGTKEDANEFEQKIGADALFHLANIHPDKPAQWLINGYNDPSFLMARFQDRIKGTEEAEIEGLTGLIFGEGPPPETARTTFLRALSEGIHNEAEPIFDEIIESKSPEPTDLAAALAYYVRIGELDRVRYAFSDHILWIEGITGPGSGPGFWRTLADSIRYVDQKVENANFLAWWERQSTAVCFVQSLPTNCSYSWEKADQLLVNPRRHQNLLLAAARNPKVIAWAEDELSRLEGQSVENYKSDWDFPVMLLLAAYRYEEPKKIHQLACGTKGEREMLTRLIGNVPTLYTEGLLREMMSINQHEHVRNNILKSAVLVAAHRMENRRFGDADFVIDYARSDGPIPMAGNRYESHLSCH